jgi:hypothetical protein
MFLGHPTDVKGLDAPTDVGIASYTHYSGRQAFAFGGDPTNDFERYEVLSQMRNERDADQPRDYRFLISAGPFTTLLPESTLVIQMAFVAGAGEKELFANAANAALAQSGAWFNLDRRLGTGVFGQETKNVGPLDSLFVDRCRILRPMEEFLFPNGCDENRLSGAFYNPIPFLPPGFTVWSNEDCEMECAAREACGYAEEDSLKFRTGVAGREAHVNWVVSTSPPPPNIRIDDHAKDGVVIYWDNYSELVPDNKTLEYDFEGYRVWRADDWTRPIGTSRATGPPSVNWRTRLQADLLNNLGDDTGFAPLRYDPLNNRFSAIRKRELMDDIIVQLLIDGSAEPLCEPGISNEECDTLKALARWELGLPGGRQYYRFIDRAIHLGAPYFYSVVSFDHEDGRFTDGNAGDPASNFIFVKPKSAAQPLFSYEEDEIYVVPNPVTSRSMAAWALTPNNSDPSGVKLEFRNLPRTTGTIRVYTLAGDLVKEFRFDGTTGVGTVEWNLISRNGQDITSGVYLYSVEFGDDRLARVVKKFTVIR